jgi:methylenetetrahydrofolate dehydrogenase (NADP+)/methenyltetrahydrofolate cyclohydrolase
MSAEIIDGREIAKVILARVSRDIQKLVSKYNIQPNITTIKIGSDASSELYLKLRDNACREVGIKSTHLEFPDNVSEKEVLKEIKRLNKDKEVHGVLIQYPIPSHISTAKLMGSVDPQKDVEGLHPFNMGRTLMGDEHLIPITPLSVLTILEHKKIKLEGKEVVIVNHSNLVGKPLAALLLNRNATVSVCHVFTKDIKKYTAGADILISAVGKPKLIPSDHVKKDAFVVDVGIVKTKKGICGDVDFDNVKEKAGIITPVPGGVGPVTVACSTVNMLKTFEGFLQKV